MLNKLLAFFSPAAFAQRGRDRERRELVAELEEHDAAAAYIAAREPRIKARLVELTREDSQAWLQEVRTLPEPPTMVINGRRVTAAKLAEGVQ